MEWLNQINPHFRLAGHHVHAKGWIEPKRIIYDHELVLFAGTNFTLEVADKFYVCSPDSFIIIPPGMEHISWNKSNSRGKRHWIHFDWIYKKDFYNDLPLCTFMPRSRQNDKIRLAPEFVPKGVIIGNVRSARAFDIFGRIYTLYNMGSSHERVISRALLLELLLELLDDGEHEEIGYSNERRLASSIKKLLDQEAIKPMRESILLKELFERMGYSYAHLYRLFKKNYGITPHCYLMNLRIERAKLLLQDTILSITEIGRKIGFDNSAYFSKVFREMTGSNPSEFRKK